MTRSRLTCALALLLLCSSIPAQQLSTTPSSALVAQTAPVRDPQALAVLGQAVAVAGGASALSAIQDYTASGQITYFWAGQEVTGPATLRGRAPDQFRLDANLPEGTRSWLINSQQGQLRDASGKLTVIPQYNAINLSTAALPHLGLSLAAVDNSFSVTGGSVQTVEGKSALVVRTNRVLSTKEDPGGEIARWSAKEYVIDAVSHVLVETRDTVFSNDTSRTRYLHEMIYSDFRSQGGVLIPFSLTERIGGQATWSVQLSSINFNTGLTDSDFHF